MFEANKITIFKGNLKQIVFKKEKNVNKRRID